MTIFRILFSFSFVLPGYEDDGSLVMWLSITSFRLSHFSYVLSELAMNTIVSLCHFCEIHGPIVLFCTQEIALPKNISKITEELYLSTFIKPIENSEIKNTDKNCSRKSCKQEESCDVVNYNILYFWWISFYVLNLHIIKLIRCIIFFRHVSLLKM